MISLVTSTDAAIMMGGASILRASACIAVVALCVVQWNTLRNMERQCEMSYMWPTLDEIPVFSALSIRYKLFRYRDEGGTSPN